MPAWTGSTRRRSSTEISFRRGRPTTSGRGCEHSSLHSRARLSRKPRAQRAEPTPIHGHDMSSLSRDLEFRKLVHQVTDPGLLGRLDSERLTAYIGFDPTADSLH